MLLSDAFCYVLLTITMTATWVQGDTFSRKLCEKHKRITKRDAAIFMDTMPIEPLSIHEPKIIYRRISSQKYGPPKSKYSLPRGKPRLKGRYSSKKYKKHIASQYPRYSKRPSKSKPTTYRPHKWPETKSIYGIPKKVTYSRYPTEPTGFGEPPPEYTSEYQRPIPTYSEQPIDSYGAPIPTSIANAYSNSHGYPEHPKLSSHFEEYDRDPYRAEQTSWHTAQQDEDFDNNYAFTKKRPSYAKPVMRPFERPEQDEEEHVNVNSYPDLHSYKNDPYYLHRKKKPQYITDSRVMNKMRLPKPKPAEDEFLVGGQYAEPPARYAKFQPSAPMYDNDEDFAPLKGFEDSDVSSATISPYVNYKNSNMAFSPQNLNDAFSILEK